MKSAIIWTAIGTAAYASVLVGAASAANEETAPYEVVESDGKFEIRDYPELTVASTSAETNDKKSGDRRFMKLFRYISGKNQGEQKIAMTTPVFMRESDDKATMSFVMPAKVAESGAPAPSTRDVVVESMEPRRYAVYRFKGLRSENREAEAWREVAAWMKEKGLRAADTPTFAYYNPPWVPGFLRRNEVLVPLSAPPSD